MAPFACPPQEVLDISAEGDLAEIPDPEAETNANVGVSTSLSGLEVVAHANVFVASTRPAI